MAELHDRFRSLDRVAVPDLWAEVEQRAAATVPEPLRVRLPALGRIDEPRVATWRLVLLLALLVVTLLVLALAFGRQPSGQTTPFLFNAAAGSAPAGLLAVDIETGQRRQVLEAGTRNLHVSPDGRWAFFERHNVFANEHFLALARTDGSGMRVLDDTRNFRIGRAWEKVWAPDSHGVAWLKLGEQRTTLMITDVAGGAPRAIDVDPGGEVSLVWSIDNAHLAYVVSASGETPSPPHLFVVDTVTGERVEAGRDLALEGSMPVWSHDGRRLAAPVMQGEAVAPPPGCTEGEMPCSILVHDIRTGKTSVLDIGQAMFDLAWSTDDLTVLGLSYGSLLGVPAEGGRPREIAKVEGGPAAWSPDASRLAWLSSDDPELGIYSLWVTDVADGTSMRVTGDVQGDRQGSWPKWSPDGEWLAFPRQSSIWIVRPDGTDERKLVDVSLVPNFEEADW